MLPTFFIIGAMKAGTTSLHHYLQGHPQVFMSTPKELHYFVAQRNLSRGKEWYEAHFAAATSSGARAVGEASPTYTMRSCFPGAPERVRDAVPDARLIYVLRHPVERMRSHYLHARAIRRETRPVDEALTHNLDYLHTSRYAYQLEAWLEHFPRERILVLTSDELRSQREETMRRVHEFLDVDPLPTAGNLDAEVHRTSDKRLARGPLGPLLASEPWRAMARRLPAPARRLHDRVLTAPAVAERAAISPRVEAMILDGLRPDLLELRGILGADFHCWGLV